MFIVCPSGFGVFGRQLWSCSIAKRTVPLETIGTGSEYEKHVSRKFANNLSFVSDSVDSCMFLLLTNSLCSFLFTLHASAAPFWFGSQYEWFVDPTAGVFRPYTVYTWQHDVFFLCPAIACLANGNNSIKKTKPLTRITFHLINSLPRFRLRTNVY